MLGDLVIPKATQPSPFTLAGHLAEHQRGNQVAPHSRRLEYKKKDAEILVHHVLAKLPHFSCLQISHDGEVGTLRRPQRGCTQAQQDGGRDQGIPAENPAKMENGISVLPHRLAIPSALLSKSEGTRDGSLVPCWLNLLENHLHQILYHH